MVALPLALIVFFVLAVACSGDEPRAHAPRASRSPGVPAGSGTSAPTTGGSSDDVVVDGEGQTDRGMSRSARAGFRDLGPLVGLRDGVPSYSVAAEDMNADGWTDLVISHHGQAATLRLSRTRSDVPLGFATAWRFHDDLHGRVDRHACAVADVDLDGLPDVYCAKGGQQGTVRKWNELWIRQPDGTFTDRAAEYGVEDVWGRGRIPVFLDLNHDRWPDLFVSNDAERADGRPTPNRTFVGRQGGFRQVRLGVTLEIGGRCAAADDYDGNGWDDLLVCGDERIHLFGRRASGFRDMTEQSGLPPVAATAARFGDFDGDGRLDLVYLHARELTVVLQGGRQRFSVARRLSLRHGHGLAVGDPDGDRDLDILVVEGCVNERDMPDWFVRVERDGSFTPERVPRVPTGCGDTAEAFDFDGDGMDEFVVLNGGGAGETSGHRGPEQLLTFGDWRPPGSK
ncbi:MAG TPA: VCBS repeat-containing protein [Actinomycetota bacterium]|nr:VCBS repeat-containing protein [Actinomycetota bacterium]